MVIQSNFVYRYEGQFTDLQIEAPCGGNHSLYIIEFPDHRAVQCCGQFCMYQYIMLNSNMLEQTPCIENDTNMNRIVVYVGKPELLCEQRCPVSAKMLYPLCSPNKLPIIL